MYAVAHDLKTIKGQLTYYHLETGRTFEYCQVFELKALTDFFNDLVSNYLTWTETVAGWQTRRNATVHQTPFPYSHYRPGQRRMAVDVYKTIKSGDRMIAQAATGIGKEEERANVMRWVDLTAAITGADKSAVTRLKGGDRSRMEIVAQLFLHA